MRLSSLSLAIVAVSLVSGCSKPAEEAASTPALSSAPAPQADSTPPPAAPEAAAAPAAPPAVALPEGFAALFHAHPEMTVTSAEVLNAVEGQFKVVGELRSSAKAVLDYYLKYFRDNGWEEDAVMEQKGNTVVSFKKDGHLQYVDTSEGGIGVIITITTGKS